MTVLSRDSETVYHDDKEDETVQYQKGSGLGVTRPLFRIYIYKVWKFNFTIGVYKYMVQL